MSVLTPGTPMDPPTKDQTATHNNVAKYLSAATALINMAIPPNYRLTLVAWNERGDFVVEPNFDDPKGLATTFRNIATLLNPPNKA